MAEAGVPSEISVASGDGYSVRSDEEKKEMRRVPEGTKVVSVKYDFYYRTTENPLTEVEGDVEEEMFGVVWERKNGLFFEKEASGNENENEPESDTEPEIKELIQDLKKRKKRGGNVNGEYVYFDDSLECVRNIHNSSISLTEYHPTNYRDFGRKKVMRAIMTPEEQAS